MKITAHHRGILYRIQRGNQHVATRTMARRLADAGLVRYEYANHKRRLVLTPSGEREVDAMRLEMSASLIADATRAYREAKQRYFQAAAGHGLETDAQKLFASETAWATVTRTARELAEIMCRVESDFTNRSGSPPSRGAT